MLESFTNVRGFVLQSRSLGTGWDCCRGRSDQECKQCLQGEAENTKSWWSQLHISSCIRSGLFRGTEGGEKSVLEVTSKIFFCLAHSQLIAVLYFCLTLWNVDDQQIYPKSKIRNHTVNYLIHHEYSTRPSLLQFFCKFALTNHNCLFTTINI